MVSTKRGMGSDQRDGIARGVAACDDFHACGSYPRAVPSPSAFNYNPDYGALVRG
jgi:hypothetical protein